MGGSRVMAADDVKVLQVTHLTIHKTKELIELQAGEATLLVTHNHRMLASWPCSEAPRDVQAGTLQIGDSVFCKEVGSMRLRQLTDVRVFANDDVEHEVYEITFSPDEPVAVFQEPSECLLSKGYKKKAVRRGLNRGRPQRSDAISVP